MTRAVAARRRAGLDVELAPRQSQRVEVRADDVIVINDEGDEVEVDMPAPEAPPLSTKIEHEDIPQQPEESDAPTLRRSTRNRVQRQPFSPRTKGQYHKPWALLSQAGNPGVEIQRMKQQLQPS